jgi:hypothetical protein
MMEEDKISRDSLNLINEAIINETFLDYKEKDSQLNTKQTQTKDKEEPYCCSDKCFKWWFFHSSFQLPSQSIIEQDLIMKPNKYSCCNVCGDCIELKLKNYCTINETSKPCVKEYCSDCFYNGCHLICCCFTLSLTSSK